MTTQNLALFKALGAKMEYLSQRQRVIAQNIANADTPGYQPKDLKPVDFGTILGKVSADDKSGMKPVTMATTNPGHMPNPESVANPESAKAKKVYEVAPAGNGVILEEQMINSASNMQDYNLITSLYQKNNHMLQIAIGAQ